MAAFASSDIGWLQYWAPRTAVDGRRPIATGAGPWASRALVMRVKYGFSDWTARIPSVSHDASDLQSAVSRVVQVSVRTWFLTPNL